MVDEDKSKRWSNFWEQGYITTFGGSATENYSSGVKAFWFHQFESLKKGSVILDTATGNGAIAILAVEYSEQFSKEFTVLAADAAVISENVAKENKSLTNFRDKIKFFSSTPCEKLPFDDSSIDLVCSQFGIEYSALQDSIPEVIRVLRSDGKFSAIMHYYLSVVILDSAQDQSMLKEAIFEYKIFDTLKQYYKDIGNVVNSEDLQLARQNPEIIIHENNLLSAFSTLREKYPESKVIDILWNDINNFAKNYIFKPKDEQLAELEKLLNNFLDVIDRQSDLQNAAKSNEDMLHLQNLAIDSGFKDFTYKKNMSSSFKAGGWNVCATM